MKTDNPRPCVRCKETIVKRTNLCGNCMKELTRELTQYSKRFDKEPKDVS